MRMKDFYDLDFLLADAGHDQQASDAVIRATFSRRGSDLPTETPAGLTEAFAQDRHDMWNAFLRKSGLESDDLAKVEGRIREGLEWIWKM